MGIILKPCCHCCSCIACGEAAKQSTNFPAPSSCFSFQSNAAMLSSVPPVHCPFATASGLNSTVMPEKAPMPAPDRFTFGEFPTARGSNAAVIHEKAPTPTPNRFTYGVSPTVEGSNSAVMPEKAPTPVPNHFTFGGVPAASRLNSAVIPEKAPTPAPSLFTFKESSTVGGSNSAVMPEKAPMPAPNHFTFGVSPAAGRLEKQDWGKSKCTGIFESTAPVPSLFSMSETPAIPSASHSLFHQTPKGPSFGDLFREKLNCQEVSDLSELSRSIRCRLNY